MTLKPRPQVAKLLKVKKPAGSRGGQAKAPVLNLSGGRTPSMDSVNPDRGST